MSQASKTAAGSEPVEKPDHVLVAGTRVDAAHPMRDGRPIEELGAKGVDAVAAALAMPDGDSLETLQLQVQAEQLAGYLRQRQEEAERREGQVNARLAEFDQEVRNARLWLDDQRQALAEREASVSARESALEARLAQCEAADRARRAEREELDERERLLTRREQDLAARRQSSRTAFPDGDQALTEADQAAGAACEESPELREQRLTQAEAELAADQEEVILARQQLEQRREQLEAQTRLDRRRLTELQRKIEAELAQKKQAIEQHSERLDCRQQALERSRSELIQQQREAIELRLAAEELQVQLAGTSSSVASERSLATLRQRLDEAYRLEAAALVQQRTELENLKAELLLEHESLSRRHQELQTWGSARREELERQAARLEAREQEFRRREEAWAGQQQRWLEERFAHKQQIRRLSDELRRQAG